VVLQFSNYFKRKKRAGHHQALAGGASTSKLRQKVQLAGKLKYHVAKVGGVDN